VILDSALVHLHYESIELSFHGGLVSPMQPDKLTRLHGSTKQQSYKINISIRFGLR
jgi:hypothetical protein